MTELAPALGDFVEFARSQLRRRRQHFGEVIEVATPVPVAHRQEKVFLRREMLVNRTFGITRRVCDVVESCWRKTFFGKHLLRGIQQKRTGVLEASLPRPTLDHASDCARESEKLVRISDTSEYIGV